MNDQSGGLGSYHFDNCTFTDINGWGICLLDVVHVNITNCQFRLNDDDRSLCSMLEGNNEQA